MRLGQIRLAARATPACPGTPNHPLACPAWGRGRIGPVSSRRQPPAVLRARADRRGRLFTAKLAVVLLYLPHQFQSPAPRVKRRKRRNGFRQSGADWETAAACVKMEAESSVLIRPLIATPDSRG